MTMGQSIVSVWRSTKVSLEAMESVIVPSARQVKLKRRHDEHLMYAMNRHLTLQMLSPDGLRGRLSRRSIGR